jgi:hypothetical protein
LQIQLNRHVQKTLPPNVDCTKTPDDPLCQTAKARMVPPNIDCTKIPKDPGCVTSTVELCTTVSPPPPECKPAKSAPLKQSPDDSCLFHPEQEKCGPDQYGNCPPGFLLNGKGHCIQTRNVQQVLKNKTMMKQALAIQKLKIVTRPIQGIVYPLHHQT